MYSVLVISFVVEIVTSIAIDPVRKALYERTSWFRNYLPTARFQTIKCTLEMLWTQAMVWFGMFFCPLLPLLGALKHFSLFYLKKWSTMRVCVCVCVCSIPQQVFAHFLVARLVLRTSVLGVLSHRHTDTQT